MGLLAGNRLGALWFKCCNGFKRNSVETIGVNVIGKMI